MHPLLATLERQDRRLLRRRAMPSFTPPMLATLTKHVFSDPAWIYEAKLDGQRSLLWRRGSKVRLITRNEKDRTSHYPDLVEAATRAEGAGADRRRGDRRVPRRRDVVLAAAGSHAERAPHPRPDRRGAGRLLPVRRRVVRRLRPVGAAVARAEVGTARRPRLRRRAPVLRAPRRGRRGRVPCGVREGLGRPDREAGELALHARPLRRLAEVQVRERAGVRRDRLDRAAGLTLGPRRVDRRLSRGRRAPVRREGRHGLRRARAGRAHGPAHAARAARALR